RRRCVPSHRVRAGAAALRDDEERRRGVEQREPAARRRPPLGRRGAEPPPVTAPIQVGGELVGMVILPPMAPGSPVMRDLTRMLSVPGTIVLIVGTTIAAALIFAPARRKLEALERA